MAILHNYILIAFFGYSVFWGIIGCTNSLNQKNYLKCRHKLEIDRQEIRKDGGYSYKAQSYEECRSPARYRINTY